MLGGDRVITAITLCMASLWSKENQGVLWKITLLLILKVKDHEVDSSWHMMVIWDTMWLIVYNIISTTMR